MADQFRSEQRERFAAPRVSTEAAIVFAAHESVSRDDNNCGARGNACPPSSFCEIGLAGPFCQPYIGGGGCSSTAFGAV